MDRWTSDSAQCFALHPGERVIFIPRFLIDGARYTSPTHHLAQFEITNWSRIEVRQKPDGRFELLDGQRRVAMFDRMRKESGDPWFGFIPAVILR